MTVNGGSGRAVRIIETPITSDSVTGVQDFTLNDHAPRNNIMDYFYFVDSNGDPVDATGGMVRVDLSPNLPIFQHIQYGGFRAEDARTTAWPKPNGYGKAVSVRITFTGITGSPTGFRSLITQSVD